MMKDDMLDMHYLINYFRAIIVIECVIYSDC